MLTSLISLRSSSVVHFRISSGGLESNCQVASSSWVCTTQSPEQHDHQVSQMRVVFWRKASSFANIKKTRIHLL